MECPRCHEIEPYFWDQKKDGLWLCKCYDRPAKNIDEAVKKIEEQHDLKKRIHEKISGQVQRRRKKTRP